MRNWTIEQIEKLQMNYPEMPISLLEEELCKSRDSIYHAAKKLGLHKNHTTDIKEKNPEKIAYLAGVIDGEGCISLAEKHHPYIRLRISNTNFELIQWLYDNFGGSIWNLRKSGNRRSQKCWTLKTFKACKILEMVLPYLIVKKPHAELAIEYQKRISWPYKGGNRPLSNLERKYRHEFFLRFKVLNQRGNSDT